MKLSDAQRRVLLCLLRAEERGDGAIRRFPGGYWLYGQRYEPGEVSGAEIQRICLQFFRDGETTTVGTLRAMEDRELLRIDVRDAEEPDWRASRVFTDAGRALARELRDAARAKQ